MRSFCIHEDLESSIASFSPFDLPILFFKEGVQVWDQARNDPEEFRRMMVEHEVAPGRFELPSLAPKAGMIDHYTTGLLRITKGHGDRSSK